MKFSRFKSRLLAFSLGLLPVLTCHAVLLDLSDVPITTGTSPRPNVMLLLDSSGSMKSLVWDDGFNPDFPYPNWCGANCADQDRWDPTDNKLTVDEINTGGGGYNKATLSDSNEYTCTAPAPAATNSGVPVMGVNSDNNKFRCLYLPGSSAGSIRVTGNYLNYLFQTFGTNEHSVGGATTQTSENLADGAIPSDSRIDTVKKAIEDYIIPIKGVNFGLAKFNGSQGANILANCGEVNTGNIASYLTGYTASGSTPMAEALYQMTRYFRGMPKSYGGGGGGGMGGSGMGGGSGSSYTSPIDFPCQSNFTIILTDGMATEDDTWPNAGEDDDLCGKTVCNATDPENCKTISCNGSTPPDWDVESPDEAGNTTPPFLKFSDGHGQSSPSEGEDIFTDDIAKFGFDTDMKTGTGFDDPPFAKQNMRTITIGFGLNAQVLKDAAYYGNGNKDETLYYPANSTTNLQASLISAIKEIKSIAQQSSASAVAASTGYFITGSSLFQGQFQFDGNDTWLGHLLRYPINTDGSVASSDKDAATELDATPEADRKIFSYDPALGTPTVKTGKGVVFNTGSGELSPDQKVTLGGDKAVAYIRGDHTCEKAKGNTAACTVAPGDIKEYRDRSSVLGTIVNSAPLYIPKPSSIYPDDWGTGSPPENTHCNTSDTTKCYSTFKKDYATRKDIIYVGANDGMLHAFDPATLKEEFAYVPNAILTELASYPNTSHSHKFYVDGTPTVIDAYNATDHEWRTVLVGSLRGGGQGIFALDITEVGKSGATLTKANVLWEFTDADHAELGYTYSRPAVVRMHNNKWVVVFGNGYNNTESDTNFSTSGDARLYFVDLFTGELLWDISTNTGLDEDPTNKVAGTADADSRPNGLATVAPVDINNDMIVDYIYAGDLFGNMWRFDVTSSNENNWAIYGKGAGQQKTTKPIFVAKYDGTPNNHQSITSRPAVARAANNSLMLFFGTGRYLGSADNTDKDVQTFYGLIDDPLGDGPTSTPYTRSDMTKQSFTETTETFDGTSQKVREFTNGTTFTYKSWYLDLINGSTKEGERVVSAPLLRGSLVKRVIFVSIIPSDQSCTGGGRSWLIELNAGNGNMTSQPVFDLNFDGQLSTLDKGTSNKVYNGWSRDGIQSSPSIVTMGNKETKYMSSSKGNIIHIDEALPPVSKGRQSWRQIK